MKYRAEFQIYQGERTLWDVVLYKRGSNKMHRYFWAFRTRREARKVADRINAGKPGPWQDRLVTLLLREEAG